MLRKVSNKLNKPYYVKLVIFAFFVFLNIQTLESQVNVKVASNIDSSFVLLDNCELASAIYPTKLNYPFYYEFEYNDYLVEKFIQSGAICKEYKTSRKLELLKKIYLDVSNNDNSFIYSLIDSSGKRISDLLQTNCGGKNELGTVAKINQTEIAEVIRSYNSWYKLFKKNKHSKVINSNINPISFSKYKWVKEIGYITEKKSNFELVKIAEEILNDSYYLSYFIKYNKLKKFFNTSSDEKEIFAELVFLTLINNETPFTPNILNFKIIKGPSCPNNKTYYQILNEIIKSDKFNADKSNFYEILNNYGLFVVLS